MSQDIKDWLWTINKCTAFQDWLWIYAKRINIEIVLLNLLKISCEKKGFKWGTVGEWKWTREEQQFIDSGKT